MANLFIDTWGWVTLGSKRESRHQEASNFYRSFQGSIYTTDYVLDETFTLLFMRYPGTAQTAMRLLLETVESGRVILERIDAERFAEACRLRERYVDKPRISFTDLTSMVVMTELGITNILTEDAHFMHVGLGLQRVP